MLRCFNDCFATLFLWLTILFFQRREWTLGSAAYTWGLGTKMSLLLSLPAVGVILFLGRGFKGALSLALLMAEVQIAIGIPFFRGSVGGYFGRAFELSREFLFKWTVNWRFIGETTFLSKGFAISLLVLHAGVLSAFLRHRWLTPAAEKSLWAMVPFFLQGKPPFTPVEELAISRRVTPRYVLTTMLSANVIGLLFARSLHYQFYAYIAWATPFLLWQSGIHPVLVYVLWGTQEWAWNVYPSTPASSGVVVGVLALTALSAWIGSGEGPGLNITVQQEETKKSR
jgi:alpha-1,3-mannosyltransferase